MVKKVIRIGILLAFLGLVSSLAYAVMPVADKETPVMEVWGGEVLTETTPTALDINGLLEELQSIPVGKSKLYYLQSDIDYMLRCFSEEELREIEFNLIPAESVLNSLANLALMQMGVTGFNVYLNEEVLPEGTFGWVLQQILGIDPNRDGGLSVVHRDFLEEGSLGKKDSYKLTINCRDIFLTLRDFGNLEGKGEWYIGGLVLEQYNHTVCGPDKLCTERKELLLHPIEDKENPGKYKFVSIYTVITMKPDGTIVGWEEWEFVPGNPEAVRHEVIQPLRCPIPQ